MGRPPIRKKGAFTPAERQARRRKKLARERRETEKAELRAKNFAKYQASRTKEDLIRSNFIGPPDLRHLQPREFVPTGKDDSADELARQLLEALHESELTMEDFEAALGRLPSYTKRF